MIGILEQVRAIIDNIILPTESILVRYRFNDDVRDSINTEDLTPTDITYGTGKIDKSSIFNGSSSIITGSSNERFSFSNGTNDIVKTYSFLFKRSATGTMHILNKDGSGGINDREYHIFTTNNLLTIVSIAGGVLTIQATNPSDFTLNQWYHGCITYNGNGSSLGWNIYIDGVNLVTSRTGTKTGSFITSQPFIVGKDNRNTTSYLDGELDELKVWSVELSALEALELAEQELSGIDIDVTQTPDPVTIPLSSIISRYKFEDNANDSVGSNNGTATSLSYVTDGVGKSGDFNGTSSNVVIPDSSDLSFASIPFSISLLVKFDALGNIIILNKMGASTNREYLVQYENTLFRFRVYSGGGNTVYKTIDYTITPTLDQWYHLVCTDDGSNNASGMKMYLDAVSVGSSSKTGAYTGIVNGNNALFLGQYSGGASILFLDGHEDEVIFWDKVLSQEEITLLATDQLAGTDINP